MELTDDELLAEWESLVRAWSSTLVARKANILSDKMYALAGRLSTTDAGREGVESFLDDEDRGVVVTAAATALAWGSAAGERALERLVDDYGLHSFDARMTLREYRAGRMRFTWRDGSDE